MSNRDETKLDDTRTDLGKINTENKEDIDVELVKSIEKLVEEETNVAKASLGNQISLSERKAEERQDTRKGDAVQMKTQILPDITEIQMQARQAEKEKAKREEKQEVQPKGKNKAEEVPNAKTPNAKKAASKDRQKKILIAAGATVAVIVVIAVVIAINVSNRKTYAYNYEKGMQFFEKKDYQSAEQYLKKAYQTDSGKKNTDMVYSLYECYRENGQEQEALETLKAVLSLDKNNEKALAALAAYYYNKKDGEALNKLLAEYRGTDAQKTLKQYEIERPIASETPGEYTREIQVSLLAEDNCKIYYTTDGTQPDKNSTVYKERISLTAGENLIKAVAINTIGIQSETAEFQYRIRYKQPEAPVISPVSGVYEAGETISMEAEEGSTVYYTTDGTMPTTDSQVYTEPFDMPEGNTVISAIAVNAYKLSSTVSRRNYIVNAAKTYTYAEAVELLKGRMKELGILTADGETAPNGAAAIFSYVAKLTIDETEIYQIRFNLKKDGITTADEFYGVGVKNGRCYRITGTEGAYTAVSY